MSSLSEIRANIALELRDLAESFHQLSLLGKLQVALLLLNVVLTTILLNVGASVVNPDSSDGWSPASGGGGPSPPSSNLSTSDDVLLRNFTTTMSPHDNEEGTQIDYTTLAISIEFAIFSLFGIIYTVSVESMFAFWGLVIVEVELAAFVTGAAAIGVLRALWLKWLIVALNWTCIAAFLLLQLVVRKSWGWHAYKQVGGGVESIQLYRRYQMLCAAIIGDAFHTIFFITCEEIIIRNTSAEQHWLVYGFCIPAVLLTFPLVLAVRKGYRVASALIYLQYVAGMGNFLYFTVLNTISVFEHDEDNLNQKASNHFNTRNQQLLVMLAEWCILLARFVLLVLALPVITSPNIASIFGKGAFSGLLLSTANLTGEEAPLNDAASDAGGHNHARRRLLVQIDMGSKRKLEESELRGPNSQEDFSPPHLQNQDGTTSPRDGGGSGGHHSRTGSGNTRTSGPRRKNSFGTYSNPAGSPVIASSMGGAGNRSSVRESFRSAGGGGRNAVAVIDVSHRSQSLIGNNNRASSIMSAGGGRSGGGGHSGLVGDSSYHSASGAGGRPSYYGSSNAASFNDDGVAMTPSSQSKLSSNGGDDAFNGYTGHE